MEVIVERIVEVPTIVEVIKEVEVPPRSLAS